jgi:hypothetical protein
MSIFISMLAFTDEKLLNAAKLGVLLASLVSAMVGLGWGAEYAQRLRIGTGRARPERTPPSDSTCGPSIASNPSMLTVKHQAKSTPNDAD